MTIAAGFRCVDGVVLCADTELTIPNWIKFPGSKIKNYQKVNLRPAFVFAGDVGFCAMMIARMVESILGTHGTANDVLKAIEEEALLIHQTYKGEYYEEESALLLCLWRGSGNQEKRQLFHVERGFLAPISQGFLGTGQFTARAMGAELFDSDMTVEQAALMSVYILAEAKTYAYGCGKDSQILMLMDNGSWNIFPNDFQHHSTISDIEEDFLKFKRSLRESILLHGDLTASSQSMKDALDKFARVVMTNWEGRQRPLHERLENEALRQAEEYTEDHSDEMKEE